MALLADPARAPRVMELVGGALELPPDERAAFLREACGSDEALHAEIDSLLRYQETDTCFLEGPAFAVGPGILSSMLRGELGAGDVLGDCRIESLLGEGGMGEVYLAEDTSLGRRVAVKLLKRHLGDEVSGRRFRHERRVLGGLTHPGIARLYGAAVSPEGRSYLVMEFVEGERLDDYCNRRGLGVPARLALFRQVCAAVAYAHQNLVIHRDLKPANIRVTPEGEPKLLDFGIAKLLDPEPGTDGGHALTLGDAMTPEYASPEQLGGETITTASDVYSLGVILYELLTGQRPYQLKSRRPEAVARAIREEEIRRPSTVVGRTASHATGVTTHGDSSARRRRQLVGDVDNIVAMAMRKEPGRRYASVAQFSEDLRRHCDGLPVQARRDTLSYRTGKFVRRNKTGVTAAALVVLALVAGLAATSLEAHRANRRFEDVRRLAKSILFEVEPQIANLPGSTQARSTLVTRASEYLDSLAQEAGGNRELRRELATAYEKVGDVQGNPNYSNLGDLKGTQASYGKARELFLSLVKTDPQDARARHALAGNYEKLGGILWWSNQTDQALANYREALTLRRALLAERPQSAEFQRGYASVQMSLGDVAAWNNQSTEALADYRQALPILQTLAKAAPDDAEAQINVARCLSRIGVAQKDAGDYTAAAGTFAEAEGIVKPVVARDPNNHSARLEQWFIVYSGCEAFIDQKVTDKALAIAPRMVALIDALAQRDPQNTELEHNLADSHDYYGEALLQAGRWQEAIDELQRSLAIDSRLAEQSPENGEYAHSCGVCRADIGEARLRLGQLAAAAEDEQAAQDLLEAAASKDPANPEPRRGLVKVFTTRGEISAHEGQPTDARQWFQRALAELRQFPAKEFVNPNDAADIAELQDKLAALR